jgi:hypothetical protein
VYRNVLADDPRHYLDASVALAVAADPDGYGALFPSAPPGLPVQLLHGVEPGAWTLRVSWDVDNATHTADANIAKVRHVSRTEMTHNAALNLSS